MELYTKVNRYIVEASIPVLAEMEKVIMPKRGRKTTDPKLNPVRQKTDSEAKDGHS